MYYLISEAAKKVDVETHVLRYWEEELELPIKRNELGHRYYTKEDIERFVQIKVWKEQGLQLKAIRLLLKDGKLMPLDDVQLVEPTNQIAQSETREEKMHRMAQLLQQAMIQTMTQVNEEQTKALVGKYMDELEKAKEHILKELNYQFRNVNEQNEKQLQQEEEHYRKLDELMRRKQKKHLE